MGTLGSILFNVLTNGVLVTIYEGDRAVFVGDMQEAMRKYGARKVSGWRIRNASFRATILPEGQGHG